MSVPADWLDRAHSNHPSDQVRAKVMCCKPLTILSPDQWLLNHQSSILAPYGMAPMANRWPNWWGVLPLCRDPVGIFYRSSRQGKYILGYILILRDLDNLKQVSFIKLYSKLRNKQMWKFSQIRNLGILTFQLSITQGICFAWKKLMIEIFSVDFYF